MTDVRPLECTSVGKRFPQGARAVHALAGIDLAIDPGEFVAVMGASGSGKSTLLHALAGLCDVDEGSIRIEGRELGGMGDADLTRFRRERIGIVFQAFNLIPTLSALDNVLLPAMDRAGAAAGARDWLTRLGLADRMDHKPDALSGGEQQRVAIARALRGDPAILLLDEPTGSLDSVAGQELCELLAEIRRQKPISIVMVTHEADVARWADRVVVLKDGRVVAGFDCGEGVDAQALGARYRECLA